MQIDFSFSTSGFRWKRNKSEITNQTKRQPRRPNDVDYREYPTANTELTYGLYHNSFPGLKLAGSMAYAPIAIPVNFMGLPIPVTSDEGYQEIFDDILVMFADRMNNIHTQCHREGTVWVWPSYDAKSGVLRWEFIPDESVTDIIVDINTRDIIKVICDERIVISDGNNETKNVGRKRIFEKNKITVKWSGDVIESLTDQAYRNPAAVLPIPFANNKDGENHRGNSDYERIVPDLKDYHDIDLAQSEMLAKFKVKQVQYFSSTVDEWLENNGYDDITDIDIAANDFIMNKLDAERTEYIFPQSAHQAWEDALKRKFRKIVEGSGLPELLWGVKTEGNHASAEEQLDTFIMFVKHKQQQKNEAYKELFSASLQLLLQAGEIIEIPDFEINWNELSAVSEKVKSEIFSSFASGIASLVNVAGLTKQQLFELWTKMYPEATEEDFEEFKIALSDMAGHKQFKDASYTETFDFQGLESGLEE